MSSNFVYRLSKYRVYSHISWMKKTQNKKGWNRGVGLYAINNNNKKSTIKITILLYLTVRKPFVSNMEKMFEYRSRFLWMEDFYLGTVK